MDIGGQFVGSQGRGRPRAAPTDSGAASDQPVDRPRRGPPLCSRTQGDSDSDVHRSSGFADVSSEIESGPVDPINPYPLIDASSTAARDRRRPDRARDLHPEGGASSPAARRGEDGTFSGGLRSAGAEVGARAWQSGYRGMEERTDAITGANVVDQPLKRRRLRGKQPAAPTEAHGRGRCEVARAAVTAFVETLPMAEDAAAGESQHLALLGDTRRRRDAQLHLGVGEVCFPTHGDQSCAESSGTHSSGGPSPNSGASHGRGGPSRLSRTTTSECASACSNRDGHDLIARPRGTLAAWLNRGGRPPDAEG